MNVNRGQRISIRLRAAHSPDTFLPDHELIGAGAAQSSIITSPPIMRVDDVIALQARCCTSWRTWRGVRTTTCLTGCWAACGVGACISHPGPSLQRSTRLGRVVRMVIFRPCHDSLVPDTRWHRHRPVSLRVMPQQSALTTLLAVLTRQGGAGTCGAAAGRGRAPHARMHPGTGRVLLDREFIITHDHVCDRRRQQQHGGRGTSSHAAQTTRITRLWRCWTTRRTRR